MTPASGTSPTPHDHHQPVPGCFRCELNEDEMTTNDGRGVPPYDSRPATREHIETVRKYLGEVVDDLSERAVVHDESKLHSPEVEVFDKFTPLLKNSTYGSDEYQAFLAGMGEGLRHHYARNDHHPEHFEGGIADMDLVQITEMLCDWKAATERHADGDIVRSIVQNAERFGYGAEVQRLLLNTVKRMGWL